MKEVYACGFVRFLLSFLDETDRQHNDGKLAVVVLPEIIPGLSEDGRMSEPLVQKTLDFLFGIGEIRSKPSAKEGILWTNRFLGK